MTTTWNPTDGSPLLSNGNLTASNPSGHGYGARVTNPFTGKKYFEFRIDARDVGECIGLNDPLNESSCEEPRPGSDMLSVGWLSFGSIQGQDQGFGGQTLASVPFPGVGEIGRVAVDETGRKWWCARGTDNWNGSATANPATGVGGVAMPSGFRPFISMRFEGNGADSVTLKIADTSWTYAAPSGFTGIDATGGAGVTGTLASTEATDTLAASAAIVGSGALSVTEARDTAAVSGSLTASTGLINVFSGTTSATLSGVLAGDMLIQVIRYVGGNGVAPTIPTGYTNISSGSANGGSSSMTVCYRIATGGETSSGTTTAASSGSTAVTVFQYRSVNSGATLSVRNIITTNSLNQATINYNAAGGALLNTLSRIFRVLLSTSITLSEANTPPAGSYTVAEARAAIGGAYLSAANTGTAATTQTQTSGVYETMGFEIAETGGNISGTLGSTEPIDTISASGSLNVFGPWSSTDLKDTLASAGLVISSGPLSTTDPTDTLAASGSLNAFGPLSATEVKDTLNAIAAIVGSGTLATTEPADTLAASGTVTASSVTGTLAISEALDTLAAAGVLNVFGPLSVTDAKDTLAATGAVSVTNIQAVLAATEALDTFSATFAMGASGALAATEARDAYAGAGTLVSITTGTLNAAEAPDHLVAAMNLIASGSLSATEIKDGLLFSIILGVVWSGSADGGGVGFVVTSATSASSFKVPSAKAEFSLPSQNFFTRQAR